MDKFFTDYESHKREIPRPKSGTGSWLLNNDAFQSWISRQDESVLWLSGHPGMGKTVLMSALIEKLKACNDPQCRVIYCFCSGKNQATTYPAILRTLVHQMLTGGHTADLLERFVKIHKTAKVHESPALLWDVFVSLIEETKGITVCVIDGLDECEEATYDSFFKGLGEYMAESSSSPEPEKGKVKWVFATRPYPDIDLYFHRSLPKKRYRTRGEDQQEVIEDDIMLFVKDRVKFIAQYKDWQDGLDGSVTNYTRDKLEGSFLWVHLTLKSLETTSSREVMTKLKEIPLEVKDIYRNIMDGISHQNIVLRILRWIVYAFEAPRPTDLVVALQVGSDDPETKEYTFRTKDVKTVLADLQLCTPMVVYEKDGSGTVHLVHQTAKEFLTEDGKSWGLDPENSHAELASTCMAFLCSPTARSWSCVVYYPGLSLSKVADDSINNDKVYEYSEGGVSDTLFSPPGDHQSEQEYARDKRSFLEYVHKLWFEHLRLVESTVHGERLLKRVLRTLAILGEHETRWYATFRNTRPVIGRYNPCPFFSIYGLGHLLKLSHETKFPSGHSLQRQTWIFLCRQSRLSRHIEISSGKSGGFLRLWFALYQQSLVRCGEEWTCGGGYIPVPNPAAKSGERATSSGRVFKH